MNESFNVFNTHVRIRSFYLVTGTKIYPFFLIFLVERNVSALENNKGRKCYRDKNRYPFHFISFWM